MHCLKDHGRYGHSLVESSMGRPRIQSRRMMKLSKSLWRQLTHGAIVIAAAILPTLTMLPVILYQASERAKGEAQVAAHVAQRQLDHLLDLSMQNTNKALPLAGRPCDEILQELAQIGNLSPYLRSIVLVRDGTVYCSSAMGPVQAPVTSFIPGIEPGLKILPVSGTPLMPAHPALLLVRGTEQGLGVIAIIDGQYLQDIREAAMDEGQLDVQILHTEQRRLLPAGEPYLPKPHGMWHISVVRKPNAFSIQVQVDAASSLVVSFRQDLWKNYAPFLFLIGLLTGYLADAFCRRRFSLVGDIQRGISHNEFYMVYQPLVNLEVGDFCGVEALVRWKHPGGGNITPDIFIPLAEDNGLIAELTRHILDLIANDLPRLNLSDDEHLGVNISGSHVAQAAFLDDMRRFLKKLAPTHPVIVLELTEREALPNDEPVQHNLQQVRDLALRLALDDFGTGHSSASYLAQFSADYIKIDRSYIQSIGKGSVNAVVLDTIINLGHMLNLTMIAEGVETEEHAAYLREQGVQFAQGYFYASAMGAAELASWKACFRARAQG